jgi:hypothetical protein
MGFNSGLKGLKEVFVDMFVRKRTILHPHRQIRTVSSRNKRIIQSHNKLIFLAFKIFI